MYTPTFEALQIINGTIFGFVFLLTCGRFAIRLKKVGKFQADDYCQLWALATLACFVALILDYLPDLKLEVEHPEKATYALGKKIWTYNVTVTVLGKTVLLAVQATFLSLYWMVFGVSKRFRMWWYIVLSYAIVGYLISMISSFWFCGAPKDITNPELCPGHFGEAHVRPILIMIGVLNVTIELSVILLPVGMLRTLEMDPVQKAGLAVVFALGFMTVAFDLIRSVTSAAPPYSTNIPIAFMWASLEPFVATTAAALPTYYSLFKVGAPRSTKKYYDEFDRSSNNQNSNFTASQSGVPSKSENGLKRDELELKLIDRQAQRMEA